MKGNRKLRQLEDTLVTREGSPVCFRCVKRELISSESKTDDYRERGKLKNQSSPGEKKI